MAVVNAETASYVNVSFTNYDDKDSSRLPDKVLARIAEITEDEEADDPDLADKLQNETPREYDYSGTTNGDKNDWVGGSVTPPPHPSLCG